MFFNCQILGTNLKANEQRHSKLNFKPELNFNCQILGTNIKANEQRH